MAGGVIAAVIALTVLGFGIKSYRTGAIPASGLAIGLAMTLMGSFVASLAGGIVAAFYQQAPSSRDSGQQSAPQHISSMGSASG